MTHTASLFRNFAIGLLCCTLGFSTAMAQDPDAPMSTDQPPQTEGFQQENAAAARKLGNFYVRPANPNAISPSVVILEMKPGDTLNDSLKIENPNEHELTLSIRGADSALTEDGQFTVKAMDKVSEEFGAWVTFEETQITLQPKEEKTVNYTLHIPEDLPHGEYKGGFAVTQTGDRSQKGVQISTTIAMGARITVTDDPQPVPAFEERVAAANVFGTPTPYFWGSLAIFALAAAYFAYGTLRDRKRKKQVPLE